MADNRIQGRVALVTGASGGIGSACAQDLFLQGAHLALTYSKNPTACEDLVASLRTSYPQLKDQRISTHRVDVGNPAEIEALIPQIEKEHGTGPDILVSNAGYGKRIVDIEYDIRVLLPPTRAMANAHTETSPSKSSNTPWTSTPAPPSSSSSHASPT
jgi:NAD(P)-dependent dehydrogenase (short-subunit alcohol dehydrogenase family)